VTPVTAMYTDALRRFKLRYRARRGSIHPRNRKFRRGSLFCEPG